MGLSTAEVDRSLWNGLLGRTMKGMRQNNSLPSFIHPTVHEGKHKKTKLATTTRKSSIHQKDTSQINHMYNNAITQGVFCYIRQPIKSGSNECSQKNLPRNRWSRKSNSPTTPCSRYSISPNTQRRLIMPSDDLLNPEYP
jgi:hypothetical protein